MPVLPFLALLTPLAGAMSGGGSPPNLLLINEIRIDQPGSDLDEYFELLVVPANASLDGLTGAGRVFLDLLIALLEAAALERDGAASAEAEAFAMIVELQYEAALARDRSERIFTQIEAAVTASMPPLEEMFDATGLATEQILGQGRRNYSGQGGPLTPPDDG